MTGLTCRAFATACAVAGALPAKAVAQPGPVMALPGGRTIPALGMGLLDTAEIAHVG